MNVLGIDFETTGLLPDTDRIIEIGAVLWNCETKTPLRILSELTLLPDGLSVSKEITAITGITPQMLENYGISFGNVATSVGHLAKDAEAIVAHNGNRFDKLFWEAAVKRGDAPAIDVLWIDTYTDLELPDGIRSMHLKYLAAEHGFLNPFSHRAVFDVLTMLTIFSQYPVETTMRLAKEPTINLQALVSYYDRAKASARGYAWKPESKQWIKSLKSSRVDREQTECGFKTIKVGV